MIAGAQLLDARQSKIKIIAKIENQEGVDNIDDDFGLCLWSDGCPGGSGN